MLEAATAMTVPHGSKQNGREQWGGAKQIMGCHVMIKKKKRKKRRSGADAAAQ